MTVVILYRQQSPQSTANLTRGKTLMKPTLTLALDSDVLETLTEENIAELEAIEDYENVS